MKENWMALKNWLIRATVKQKITLAVCAVAIVTMAGIGIYQMIPQESPGLSLADSQATDVRIRDITEAAEEHAEKLANTPAETAAVETTVEDAQATENVVSNTTTIETPTNTEEIYIADDGAHYESEPVYTEPTYSEPVYEEPAYEEPVYEEPASDGGWDGGFGDNWSEPDYSGSEDYGTGISN